MGYPHTTTSSGGTSAGVSTLASFPSLGVIPFSPTQNIIPLGFTTPPAINSTVTVTVTPSAIATATLYPALDRVIVSEVDANGFSSKIAWFEVVSVAGNAITIRLIAGNTSTVFAANSEITGQTRLPSIPPTAVSASIVSTITTDIERAASNTASQYNALAQNLAIDHALVYAGLKTATGPDINLLDRYGVEMRSNGIYQTGHVDDLSQWRCVSAAPLALLPRMEVTYR